MRLSPEGRAFLEATRGLDEPTDRDRRRIRAKTLAAVAAAGAAGTVTTKAAAAGAGSALATGGAGASLGWVGGALTGALLALAVLGGQAAFELATGRGARSEAPRHDGPVGAVSGPTPRAPSEPSTNVEPVRDRREESAAPTAPTAPVALPRPSVERGEDGARAAPAASRDGAPPGRGPLASMPAPGAPPAREATADARPMPVSPPPPAPVANAMDEELAALREAHEALRTGRPDEAVRVLDRFAASHAGGALEEERRAARIVAACKAGGGSQARADAERFLHERPDAPLGERIRATCLQKASP